MQSRLDCRLFGAKDILKDIKDIKEEAEEIKSQIEDKKVEIVEKENEKNAVINNKDIIDENGIIDSIDSISSKNSIEKCCSVLERLCYRSVGTLVLCLNFRENDEFTHYYNYFRCFYEGECKIKDNIIRNIESLFGIKVESTGEMIRPNKNHEVYILLITVEKYVNSMERTKTKKMYRLDNYEDAKLPKMHKNKIIAIGHNR